MGFSRDGLAVHHRLGKPSALPEDSQRSTISAMIRVAVSNSNPIPLTLTLSHREREQPAAVSVVRELGRADTALGCAERQRRILPFPKGEGRGEGEGDACCANRSGTSPDLRSSRVGRYGFEPFIILCLWFCRRSLMGSSMAIAVSQIESKLIDSRGRTSDFFRNAEFIPPDR